MGFGISVKGMSKGSGDPSAKVLMPGKGGKSSVVRGGGSSGIIGGPEKGYEMNKTVGTKRFDVGSKSLNRGRKM